MRVVHVVHGKANPDGHNGISRVVYNLNKHQRLIGSDSKIWAIVDGVRSRTTLVRDRFVSVECFPRVRVPWRADIVDELIGNRDHIDLVHLHLIWFLDKNIITAALRRAGIPVVVTTHGTYSTAHAYTGKRRLARYAELSYLADATEVHALTREEGTGLHRYGYDGPIYIAHNGVSMDEIPATRSRTYFDGKSYRDRCKLLWVGVLRRDKNIGALIRAISMLPTATRKALMVVLVGPDYQGNAARFRAQARDLGCEDSFDHIGPLYGQEKYDAIESADAYVMPSVTEGFSLSLLDAMACGKPTLVTSGCGMNYLADVAFNVRCEPYAQDIAFGISELLRRRDEWSTLGGNALRIVKEKLSWTAAAEQHLKHYSRIVRGAE